MCVRDIDSRRARNKLARLRFNRPYSDAMFLLHWLICRLKSNKYSTNYCDNFSSVTSNVISTRGLFWCHRDESRCELHSQVKTNAIKEQKMPWSSNLAIKADFPRR